MIYDLAWELQSLKVMLTVAAAKVQEHPWRLEIEVHQFDGTAGDRPQKRMRRSARAAHLEFEADTGHLFQAGSPLDTCADAAVLD